MDNNWSINAGVIGLCLSGKHVLIERELLNRSVYKSEDACDEGDTENGNTFILRGGRCLDDNNNVNIYYVLTYLGQPY